MATAQEFVDSLNRAEMPRLGYVYRNVGGRNVWCWPRYDFKSYDTQDFKKPDATLAQWARTGVENYADIYPADERARRAA